jgi:hypothetical protein
VPVAPSGRQLSTPFLPPVTGSFRAGNSAITVGNVRSLKTIFAQRRIRNRCPGKSMQTMC